MTDDKVKPLRAVSKDKVDPERAAFVEFIRELYDAAREGTLHEFHGVLVYLEEGQVDLVAMTGGITVSSDAEVIVELEDLALAMRQARRAEIDEVNGEDEE